MTRLSKALDYYISNDVNTLTKTELHLRLISNLCSGFDQVPTEWKNIIFFTVHLRDEKAIKRLSKVIFFHCEKKLKRHGCQRQPCAYSGVISILDFEGSNYSGANLDRKKPHIHGVIVLPDDLNSETVHILAESLQEEIESYKNIIRTGERSVGFDVIDNKAEKDDHFPRSIEDFLGDIQHGDLTTVVDNDYQYEKIFSNDNLNQLFKWLAYCLKYERKSQSGLNIHIFPFDLKSGGRIDPKYLENSDRHFEELEKNVSYDPVRRAEAIKKRAETRRWSGRKGYVPKRNQDFLY